MPHAFPPNYPILPNWVNFGAQFRTYTAFYKTFEAADIRKDLFVTQYTDNSGQQVQLVEDNAGNPLNNARSFKYVPDPVAVGEANGNDIVYIRLADILLSRAEALNEKMGPNPESVDLMNMIRTRVKAPLKAVLDFTSKQELRDFLLAERGREFYTEGLRREDLVRHGKFISVPRQEGTTLRTTRFYFPFRNNKLTLITSWSKTRVIDFTIIFKHAGATL